MKSFRTAVEAVYTPQKMARMKDNILIEALPQAPSDDDLLEGLGLCPDFNPEQRSWDNHDRIQQIKSLANFMVPLDRHLELARMVDSMMREGYVSRAPRTKAFVQKLQETYALQKQGKTFHQSAASVSAQDSTALLGVPGMGKSTTVKRALARYPQVISHDDGEVVQITHIHVDMSSSGRSVKALAIAIIAQIDRAVPENGYYNLYLRGAAGASTELLIHNAGRLLHIHHVGLVVADEIQNLAVSGRGAQVVMTELVTMCNTFEVPLLFIGTNKATKVLGADFRSARRGVGTFWGPLPRLDSVQGNTEDGAVPSEWAEFASLLLGFQWVRNPIVITKDLLDYLHHRTQGVIDLLIKLVAIAQVRSILYGDETLSIATFEQVYQEDFRLLHVALDAMAGGDKKAFALFEDVRPLDLDSRVHHHQVTASAQAQRAHSPKPGESGFVEAVAAGLMSVGISSEQASSLALAQQEEGTARDSLDAVAKIANALRPKKGPKLSKLNAVSATVHYGDFTNRPRDYRRAIVEAATQGTSIIAQLKLLGHVRNVEEMVPLGC